MPTRRIVAVGIPGAEVAVVGSKRANRRRPLDCRALVAVAVYALPLAAGTASTGQTASTNYQMPSGSQEISVVAEASLNVPFKLALVNPSGLTLQTVDAVNGTAVLNATVSQSGVYVIKVINVSLGPLQFTTTATPLVTR